MNRIAVMYLVAVCIVIATCKITEKPLSITTKEISPNVYAYAINFFYLSDSKIYSTPQLIDFNYSNVLIGDIGSIDWGIKCSEDIRCKIKPDSDVLKDKYKSYKYSYMQGDVKLQLNEVDLKEEDLLPVDFRYIKSIDSAYDLGWGVVGLQPDSQFVKSLISMHGDINLSVSYKYDNHEEHDWGLTMLINHSQSGTIASANSVDTNKWKVKAKLNNKHEVAMCFEIADNYLLKFQNADQKCQKEIRNACNGQNSCTWKQASVSKASDIQLEINETTLTFKGSDYLYNNKGLLGCRMVSKKITEECELTYGRYAVKKYPLIFKFNNQPSIQFLEYFHYPQNTKLVIYIILSTVIALLIFIFVSELIIRKSRISEINEKENLI